MDETTVSLEWRPDGFEGQRMVVLPRPQVRQALAHPVTRHLVVTDAGVFPRAASHGRVRPDGCGEHILLVCTDGAGTCVVGGARFEVKAGDAVVIPAGEPHEYAAAERDPWTVWWLHVAGPGGRDLVAAAVAGAGGNVVHLRDATAVASLVAEAVGGLGALTLGSLVRAAGCAWHALSVVAATGRRARGEESSVVDRAVAHLRRVAPARTSVAELAAMVGVSPSHLTALFREQVGMPPLRYQRDLRLARARELLDTGGLPVAAVAAACGYDDPLYFSRVFAAVHGVSPTAYCARAR